MNPTAAATPLLDWLNQQGVFDTSPLVLIDAGCRGGISPAWRRFAPHLVAHGFDPLVDDCERLAATERLETVHYHARYLGLPDDDAFVVRGSESVRPNPNPWDRLSAARAAAVLAARTSAAPPRLASANSRIGITEFAREQQLASVDFLKIDVDGDDYGVLRSAAGIMPSVLGVSIEVNYFGSDAETDNTFHNVDRYMRERRFELFGINSRLYSHAALPAPFVGRGPGATTFGRPLQGHALYLRDLSAPHRRDDAQTIDVPRLARLAALFELFVLPDCAAELIVTFSDRFMAIGSPARMLDALASGVSELPYREYLHRFENDPLANAAAKTPKAQATSSERQALVAANEKLQRKLADLKERYDGVRKKLQSDRDRLKT